MESQHRNATPGVQRFSRQTEAFLKLIDGKQAFPERQIPPDVPPGVPPHQVIDRIDHPLNFGRMKTLKILKPKLDQLNRFECFE
jgi:hypothetical protein